MTKHRRYSIKRNKRNSRKMRGGFDTPSNIDFENLIPTGTPPQNSVSDISFNMSEEGSLGPGLDIDDLNVTGNSNEGNTTVESQNSISLNDSISTINTDVDGSFVGDLDDTETDLDLNTTTGGKRKRKFKKS